MNNTNSTTNGTISNTSLQLMEYSSWHPVVISIITTCITNVILPGFVRFWNKYVVIYLPEKVQHCCTAEGRPRTARATGFFMTATDFLGGFVDLHSMVHDIRREFNLDEKIDFSRLIVIEVESPVMKTDGFELASTKFDIKNRPTPITLERTEIGGASRGNQESAIKKLKSLAHSFKVFKKEKSVMSQRLSDLKYGYDSETYQLVIEYGLNSPYLENAAIAEDMFLSRRFGIERSISIESEDVKQN